MKSDTHIPLPPEEMQSGVGRVPDADTYLEIGRDVKEVLLQETGVGPADSILDIGCGSGRVARHFVDYVRSPGRYVGMDIMKEYVAWCEENIAPVNPAFHFYHQDIYNGYYNPEGSYRGSEYRFPFEDESFDLIFLTSVFTHLLPNDANNYLREISRLLKPGGRCFCTWFLLGHDVETNYVSYQALEERMEYGFRSCVEMLERNGLTLAEKPKLGRWRAGGGPLSHPLNQDRLILERASGGQAHPAARHEAPETGDLDLSEATEVSGSIESFDPVRHAVTIGSEEGPRTSRIARDAVIRVNRQAANSRALRPGQEASLELARVRGGDERVARQVRVIERLELKQINGVVEFVDLNLRLITLNHAGGFETFELDPESTRVRVKGEIVSPDRLRRGQRASIRYVLSAKAIGFRDSTSDA